MKTSKEWIAHFKENLKSNRINWDLQPEITDEEKKPVLRSLQAWQLGETSDGANLLKATTKYAGKTGDPHYIEAVKLFIIEEQKHGESLGRYLDRIHVNRLKKDWGDTLFRKVRYFNTNMEVWTITVIIVESFAQLFYQALADASNCVLLKQICMDILEDEAHHIRFQRERLCIITCKRNSFLNNTVMVIYSLLFFGVFCFNLVRPRQGLQSGRVWFYKAFKGILGQVQRYFNVYQGYEYPL